MAPGYRDDHEAALRRADALERELAEAKDDLAEKERAIADQERMLADKDRAIADREHAIAAREREGAERRVELERAATRADGEVGEARAQLDALRRAPAKLPTPRTPPTRAPRDDDDGDAWARRRRVLASMLWHGDLVVSWMGLVLFVPMVAMSFYLTGIVTQLKVPEWVFVAGGLGPWFVVFVVPWLYLPFKYRYLMRWARSGGYTLDGYPEVLASRLSSTGDATVRVHLWFAGDAPDDLASIVRGFDAEVRVEADGRLVRPCPTTDRRRRDPRRPTDESCWRLHAWLRRFERTVLRPLHQAHPLAWVTIVRD